MKVSIVVPVYNSGKYIERCLDSILDSLGKTDGEILAIDNNSTDNSVKILKQYAKEYPAVKVLSCKTPGASAARNYGTKQAKGDYLWFVDSDDTIDKKAIRKLLKCAKKNQADFVMLGMKRIYPDGHEDYLYAINPKDTDAKHCFVRYGLGPMQVFSRRAWWSKHFKFKEGIIHEDMELMSTLIRSTIITRTMVPSCIRKNGIRMLSIFFLRSKAFISISKMLKHSMSFTQISNGSLSGTYYSTPQKISALFRRANPVLQDHAQCSKSISQIGAKAVSSAKNPSNCTYAYY